MTKSMQSLFRGFVPTKNKKCVMPFKGKSAEELMTYEQVKDLDEFAGILADDTILIDIDDLEQSEIFMNIVEERQLNCPVIRTSRGRHGLFKNSKVDKCATHVKLACGLTADIKVGHKNSYSVLKFEGKERFIEWDIEEGQEYQEIPKWMFPVRSAVDFTQMDAGDGRNQALFNYILTLQSSDFSIEEARETIRILNKYVLKDPLDEDELEVVLRDDAFTKPIFFKGTAFLFDKFSMFMKSNHHIIRINNQLHSYKEGIYVSGLDVIESDMIKHIPQLNRSKRTEVLSYLDLMVRENHQATATNFVAFRNGLYNIHDDTFIPFTPEHIITNVIDWDYNPNAYDELTDKTMNKISCGDPAIRALLEEAVGYCMFRRNELGKAFILTGSGSNGKSTFLNMIRNMLGEKNISSLDLKKLGDRFSTVMMFGKLANIGDDISDEFVMDSSVFKKIVTGESIDAEQKGQPKFEFKPYVKLFFSTNNIPRMGKGRDSSAILRRLIIIPFEARFTTEDPDFVPFIGDKLTTQEATEYLIQLGIQGLKRVLENRKFTESEKVQKELEEYAERNNPVLSFINDCEDEEIQIENESVDKVFQKYQEFCIQNGYIALAKNEFSKQIQRNLNLTTERPRINKVKTTIFISIVC